MEYTQLTDENKVEGLLNRIGQLEIEHYSNEVYAFEAELIGSEHERQDFIRRNDSIKVRIDALRDKVEELSKDTVTN